MNKMRICSVATTAVAFLVLANPAPALGDNACNAAQQDKSFKGNVASVDASGKTFSVKGLLFTRNFNIAADCKVSLEDKAAASLADLRPGQKVNVRYQDDNGVLIAMNIAQHDLAWTGHITAIDPARRLALKVGMITHNLAVAPDCAVILKGGQAGMWSNLQIGDTVHVIYEPVNGSHLARRIEQTSDMFIGTIQAVDATTRSIKVKAAFAEKKFNLADRCPIVINGKLNGGMGDLRIGEKVSLSYDNKDGVLVANRVSPMAGALAAEPAAPAPSQTAAANGLPPSYGY
jgi:cold shock CspA family protein